MPVVSTTILCSLDDAAAAIPIGSVTALDKAAVVIQIGSVTALTLLRTQYTLSMLTLLRTKYTLPMLTQLRTKYTLPMLTMPSTQYTLSMLRLLLSRCVQLDWNMDSFCLFCGLFLDWFLLGVLWDLVEHGMLGLFFDRDRLCLLCLLLLLKCACCCFLC